MPEATGPRRILAGDLWAVFNFGDPKERYRRFLRHHRASFQHLVDSVLLYDSVEVPTQDFLVIAVLLRQLGERAVVDLLSSGSLRFIHMRGSLGYSGRRGLSHFWIDVPPDVEKPNPYSPPDEALGIVLAHLRGRPKGHNFQRLVLEATTEVNAEAALEEVRRETIADLRRSPELRKYCGLREGKLDPLPGLPPNQVRIYGGVDSDEWSGDATDLVLALAAANTELWLAEHSDCMDASTASPIGQVLKSKVVASTDESDALGGFATLCEIAGVPDLAEGVLAWRVPMSGLLRLKGSRDGEQFRTWFHENCRTDAKAIAREYARLIQDIPMVERLPARVVRFLAVTAFCIIASDNPLVGAAVGAADSFFVARWLRGHSPKFFVDKLRKLGKN
jgi:hypothetical protein